MAETQFDRQLFDRITTGVIRSMEKRPGVCSVELDSRPQAQRHQLVSWEQQNACSLPEDFKNFYQMTDGLLLRWSVKLDGEMVHPVGCMELNPIKDVTRIGGDGALRRNNPSLADLDDDDDDNAGAGDLQNDASGGVPTFDHRSRLFELDSCQGCGKVCLVYKNIKQGTPAKDIEIWFLDTALRWHFLTSSFSQYFRLMMVHMGLPQWQYAFTDVGLPPLAKQWFNLYGPYRLEIDSSSADAHAVEGESPVATTSADDLPIQKLDVGKLFRGKSDKKNKISSGHPKKKTSATNKPPSGGLGGRSNQITGSSRLR